MKSLLKLHTALLTYLGEHCSTNVALDIEYMKSRVEAEGESFLTITLPSFGKCLEKALSTGRWDVTSSSSFARVKGLPAFLGGFLTSIFNKDGRLLDNPDAECIWAVRQFCYLTQKIERDCTPERERAAIDQYVRTDEELRYLPGRIPSDRVKSFVDSAFVLFGDLFQHCDNVIANWDLIPQHGNGNVAEKLSPREKWSFPIWTERLERVFPFWRYTQNIPSVFTHDHVVTPDAEPPVRVVTVPKTQKTPRIIAIEPVAMQFAQQGLKNEIYDYVNSDELLSKIIGFTDQTRNRKMAESASLTGLLATLDLSEASDRVHWWLVSQMTERFPHLRDFLWATRSQSADVPYHGVIPLVKFASMGSALTFPIEAIVFTTLAWMGMRSGSPAWDRKSNLVGTLSVYGDDIIVPVNTVDFVIDELETFGFKVNRSKSFWTGKFRESCGAEYFNGSDVSVVRLKHEIPSSRSDAAELSSFVKFRNRCYNAGMWSFCSVLDDWISPIIKLYPTNDDSAGLGRESFLEVTNESLVDARKREHPAYQVPQVNRPYLKGHSKEYTLDGESGLLDWFYKAELLDKESQVLVDRHASQERPVAFSIYNRWSNL